MNRRKKISQLHHQTEISYWNAGVKKKRYEKWIIKIVYRANKSNEILSFTQSAMVNKLNYYLVNDPTSLTHCSLSLLFSFYSPRNGSVQMKLMNERKCFFQRENGKKDSQKYNLILLKFKTPKNCAKNAQTFASQWLKIEQNETKER